MLFSSSTLLYATATSGTNNEILKGIVSNSTSLGGAYLFYHFVYPRLANNVEYVYNKYYATKNDYLTKVKHRKSDSPQKVNQATVDIIFIASLLLGVIITFGLFFVFFYDATSNSLLLDLIMKYAPVLVFVTGFFLLLILTVGAGIAHLRICYWKKKIYNAPDSNYNVACTRLNGKKVNYESQNH